ncbi:transcription factor HES-1-like [Asterias amurensis]|uniref:transcription factor HES-1-like n=1 Tax=Asterias amurensis TaxID=7602 RepID=UPI003AB8C61F
MYANAMMHESAIDRPKTSKHMMERKRRARINDSLLQLKSLVFPAIRKEISRQPKMEKADILEMTVRYLKEVQSTSTDGRTSPSAQISQYHAGYSECLGEASSFLSNCESIDLETRLRIMNHLADRCSSLNEPSPAAAQGGYSYRQNAVKQTTAATTSPASSPVPKSTTCSTYMPAQQQNQLMLCIPSDFVAHSNPSLLSQSSTQSSIIFPTPPPSPVEQKQYTRLPSPHQYKPKVKSAMATSVRRHKAVSHHVVPQENVWRPW